MILKKRVPNKPLYRRNSFLELYPPPSKPHQRGENKRYLSVKSGIKEALAVGKEDCKKNTPLPL
jgi:hypothetical protein